MQCNLKWHLIILKTLQAMKLGRLGSDFPEAADNYHDLNIRRSYVSMDNVESMNLFESRQNLLLHDGVQIERRKRGTLFIKMHVGEFIP